MRCFRRPLRAGRFTREYLSERSSEHRKKSLPPNPFTPGGAKPSCILISHLPEQLVFGFQPAPAVLSTYHKSGNDILTPHHHVHVPSSFLSSHSVMLFVRLTWAHMGALKVRLARARQKMNFMENIGSSDPSPAECAGLMKAVTAVFASKTIYI